MNFDPVRFKIASGSVTHDRWGGTYRDLDVIENPWLKQQRDKGALSWSDEAEAESAKLRMTPYAVRIGEMEFSTSQALVRWPSIVWDVNAYYAQLGVSPHATRKQIKQAYFDRKGYRSERLTYIVKQLFDPQVRRAYDACRPGSVFFDKYVAEYVKAKAMEEHRAEFGRSLSFEEQMAEGLQQIDLDSMANSEIKLEEVDLDGRHSPVVGSAWKWGYYLWRTSSYDIDKLAAWQQSLCVAFKDQPRRLCVGLMGGDEEVQVIQVDGHSVAFINVTAEPTPILARQLIQKRDEDD